MISRILRQKRHEGESNPLSVIGLGQRFLTLRLSRDDLFELCQKIARATTGISHTDRQGEAPAQVELSQSIAAAFQVLKNRDAFDRAVEDLQSSGESLEKRVIGLTSRVKEIAVTLEEERGRNSELSNLLAELELALSSARGLIAAPALELDEERVKTASALGSIWVLTLHLTPGGEGARKEDKQILKRYGVDVSIPSNQTVGDYCLRATESRFSCPTVRFVHGDSRPDSKSGGYKGILFGRKAPTGQGVFSSGLVNVPANIRESYKKAVAFVRLLVGHITPFSFALVLNRLNLDENTIKEDETKVLGALTFSDFISNKEGWSVRNGLLSPSVSLVGSRMCPFFDLESAGNLLIVTSKRLPHGVNKNNPRQIADHIKKWKEYTARHIFLGLAK